MLGVSLGCKLGKLKPQIKAAYYEPWQAKTRGSPAHAGHADAQVGVGREAFLEVQAAFEELMSAQDGLHSVARHVGQPRRQRPSTSMATITSTTGPSNIHEDTGSLGEVLCDSLVDEPEQVQAGRDHRAELAINAHMTDSIFGVG